MEHNLDNFYQNKWIRSCFCDSYYSNDSQLSVHGTRMSVCGQYTYLKHNNVVSYGEMTIRYILAL